MSEAFQCADSADCADSISGYSVVKPFLEITYMCARTRVFASDGLKTESAESAESADRQPTCPQCAGTKFTPISPTLQRCIQCRWLCRLSQDGEASTAFDPWRRPASKRRVQRARQVMQILDDLQDK